MNYRWVALFLFLLPSPAILAQNIVSGQVQSSQGSKAIPYVNIGIIQIMRGTVSDSEGQFELKYQTVNDSVTFSAIGYQQQTRSVSDLLSEGTVYLEPRIYNLDEISVIEKPLGDVKDLGHNIKKRRHSIGFGSTQLGTELGALIEIKKQTYVYSAHFIFNRAGNDSNNLLFRVNLYDMKNGTPGQNVIPENVLFKPLAISGELKVDLSYYDIVVEDDVLLSVEWVEAVSLENGAIQDISFRAQRSERNPNAWFRTTSQAKFASMNDLVKYKLGFYLSGIEVDP